MMLLVLLVALHVCRGDGEVELKSGDLSVGIEEADSKEYRFTVKGETDGWIAVGINTKAQMPGASIVECFKDGGVAVSYASGRTKPTLLSDSSFGVKKEKLTYKNKVLECVFTRKKSPSGKPSEGTFYKLPNEDICVVASKGEGSNHEELKKHTKTYKLGCSAFNSGATSRLPSLLLALPGCLLAASWMHHI